MQHNRKTGVSFFVDVPTYIKMTLKEKESKGSAVHQKVITLLKQFITNLENGIKIVTWNEVTCNILRTSKNLCLCPAKMKCHSHPICLEREMTKVQEREEKHREGGKRNYEPEEATDFFSLFLSFFPGQKCLPATLRSFCGTGFCTVTFFEWKWLAYISFPEKWNRRKPFCVFLPQWLNRRRLCVRSLH